MDVKNKISGIQLFLILIHSQIGVGIITLVNEVHVKARSDSWISVIISGIAIQIVIIIFWSLVRRFPGKNLFEIIEIVLGKFIGKIIVFFYCLFFISTGAILFAKYTIILKSWMLPLTPKSILIGALSIITVYLAIDNLQVISRFFILASSVLLVFLGFVIFSLKDANYTYIMPIGVHGVKNILKGAVVTSLSFQGFEYALFFAPFVKMKKNTIIKTMTWTNVFVTLFYTFVVLATQLFFSSNELELVPEPIFYLVKSFSFKVIERPDLIFISLWLVLVVTSSVVLFFMTSFATTALFNVKNRTPFVYITVSFSFFLSLLLYGEELIDRFTEIFQMFFLAFSISIPIIVFCLSLIFRKKGDQSS